MRRLLSTALATTLLLISSPSQLAAQAPASAATESGIEDVVAPLKRFQSAFNGGVWTFPSDVFTDDAVAVDGFAPFVWQGHGGVRTWYAALLGSNASENEAFLAQKFHLEIGTPITVRRDGDRAYIVFPATNSWTKDGKRQYESARWAVTFLRGDNGWRISANAWNIVAEGIQSEKPARRLRHKRI